MLRFRQGFMLKHNFGEAQHRGQRRAQFVRHARQKERTIMSDATQLAVRLFERLAVLAQFLYEAFDPLVLVAHGYSAVRITDADDDWCGDEAQAVERRPEALWKDRDGDQRADQHSARVNWHGDARVQARLFKNAAQILLALT